MAGREGYHQRREFGFREVEGYGLRGFETSTLARDTASRVGSVGAGIRAVWMKWDSHRARGVFAAAHVGWFGGEGDSREVRRRRRQRPRRGRPSAGAGEAAKREDELGREGSSKRELRAR